MIRTLLLFSMVPFLASSQAILNSWQMNTNGQKASYYAPSGMGPNMTFSYVTTNDSASVLKTCYSTDSVWIYSHGMVFNMGKYSNPGNCSSKVYIWRFPRNPQPATTKSISPKVGAIGALVNGIPMYGLGDSKSWNGTSNVANGPGVWNMEVYKGEGVSLDTALSAHPQQQGAYHSHAKPRRLYQNTPTTQHSPIVGFAFDGYPVYGPYGYSDPNSASSSVTRMKTGYALRSITTRTTLPYGVTLTSSQYGPPVNSTYPIGTYCEDYEWSSANGGDLDKYNGRTCVTPEYPNGTYAYFVTIDAAGTPQFPYYVGVEYYGKPDPKSAGSGVSTGLKFPSSGSSCQTVTDLDEMRNGVFAVYPNPSTGSFNVKLREGGAVSWSEVQVIDMSGRVVHSSAINGLETVITLDAGLQKGLYLVQVYSAGRSDMAVTRLVID